jgi:hypothetical protein
MIVTFERLNGAEGRPEVALIEKKLGTMNVWADLVDKVAFPSTTLLSVTTAPDTENAGFHELDRGLHTPAVSACSLRALTGLDQVRTYSEQEVPGPSCSKRRRNTAADA